MREASPLTAMPPAAPLVMMTLLSCAGKSVGQMREPCAVSATRRPRGRRWLGVAGGRAGWDETPGPYDQRRAGRDLEHQPAPVVVTAADDDVAAEPDVVPQVVEPDPDALVVVDDQVADHLAAEAVSLERGVLRGVAG